MATHGTLSPNTAAPTSAARPATGVRAWAWATLAFLVLVVLWGAVVRATSSGAGCGANWPLCNGDFVPHHPRLATIIEFTHRSMSGICTVMVAVLLGWTFYATPQRHPARRAAIASSLLLVTEALLGAVLVLRHLVEKNTSFERVVMQSVHFTNTMLLLAAVTLTAVFLSRPGREAAQQAALRTVSILALAATVITGATGSLAALADTIFPSPDLRSALAADWAAHSPLLIRMRWMHPAASALAILLTAFLIYRYRAAGRTRLAVSLSANLIAQVLIGSLDVLLLAPTWLQVLHLLSADIFWITLVAVTASALFPRVSKVNPQPA